jgi:hypothetical protein
MVPLCKNSLSRCELNLAIQFESNNLSETAYQFNTAYLRDIVSCEN